MNLRPETKAAFQNILDTMSGMDGGVRFVQFRCLVESLDAKAASGDPKAEQIITVILQLSRLIDVANK